MSQLGFLGAVSGAGRGIADVGGAMLKDSLDRQKATEDAEREARIQENKIAAQSRMLDTEQKNKLEQLDVEHQNRMEEDRLKYGTGSRLGSHTPAQIQTIEWAAKKLFNGDMNKAAEWAKRSAANPQQTALNYARETMRQQQAAFMQPGDPGYMSFDDAYGEAIQSLSKYGGDSESPAQTPPSSVALPPEAAAKLKPGVNTTFGNGQVWTIGAGGKPERVK